MAAYHLVDPGPLAKEAPYTFQLPSCEELGAIGHGDLVKLIFAANVPDGQWSAERMWVEVTRITNEACLGLLRSVPLAASTALRDGEVIRFTLNHVIAIEWAQSDSSPVTVRRRQFWSGCVVDKCVLDRLEPVEFIYREKPCFKVEMPDSGWRIRGRRGADTEADMASREAIYVALGAVLNIDDSWLDWIDAPVGTALQRDSASGAYLPQ